MTTPTPAQQTPYPVPDLSQQGNQPAIPERSSSLDRQDFLQLLTTQLANQDPTNPQDGHEFAAQLAQFSSVEQLTNISGTLALHSEQLALLSEGMAVASSRQAELSGMINDRTTLSTASAMIGQTVEAPGNTTVWDGESPSDLSFKLDAPAADVTITIRDENGEIVRTIEPGHLGDGSNLIAWDGLTDDGSPAEPGAYTFEVEAYSTSEGGTLGEDGAGASREEVGVTTYTRGTIDRITIGEEGASLWMGPHAISLDDVISVIP